MTRTKMAIAAIFAILATASLTNAQQTSGISYVDNYEQAVEMKDKKILVVFGADWCKYCQDLKRDVHLLQLDGYVVCMIDADERLDLKTKHSFKMLPTSLIIFNKKEISRKSGYSKQDYGGWLEKQK
jgi:thiol-disulfide isomerase/thioredoxin